MGAARGSRDSSTHALALSQTPTSRRRTGVSTVRTLITTSRLATSPITPPTTSPNYLTSGRVDT